MVFVEFNRIFASHTITRAGFIFHLNVSNVLLLYLCFTLTAQPNHDPNTHHCLCGADGESLNPVCAVKHIQKWFLSAAVCEIKPRFFQLTWSCWVWPRMSPTSPSSERSLNPTNLAPARSAVRWATKSKTVRGWPERNKERWALVACLLWVSDQNFPLRSQWCPTSGF